MSIPIAWSEIYAHPLPGGHRFPMEKYKLLPEQLLYEGTIAANQLFSPSPLSEEQILSTHSSSYWDRLSNLQLSPKEQRASGFPHSIQLIDRERVICGGTLKGAEHALLNNQCALNVAGGTHHAYADRAEGFCLLNDVAISANFLMTHHEIERILVIDLDVHQGNGTAKIFENDDRVFTFSMHGEKNYPFRKEASDLDVPLPDGIQDDEYLALLRTHTQRLMSELQPQFVFYQAGVDILDSDKLGKLCVTKEGCKERDRIVLAACSMDGVPLHITMGGGYSPNLSDIVDAHANTFRLAMHFFS
ncbi:MAG: histone deacetylase [Cryomorphaceae bacterium]